MKDLPVLTISNFEDYNHCHHCGNSFYIRNLDKHLKDNLFLDRPHGHDFFILLFITSGSGMHSIDFKNYHVKAGSLFLLSPGQVHHWNLSSDINGYILFFTKEYFQLDFNYNKLLTLPFFYTHINSPCMEIKEEDIEQVSNIFKKIDDEYLNKRKLFHDVIRLNLKMLLIELERKYTGNQQASGLMQYQMNQLHKLETLIDAHYKEHKQISEYASIMNISIKQLNTLCKKALNKTPGDLLQERLILEAKRLLVYSDNSISSIAYSLNYTDNSYFIRLFRKLTTMTPEQFRIVQLSECIS
ncbi:AraC family transcriptional regulator [Sporocytophaga myxococcoides]|uniref:AraC family transcriptional regulator n=1 Tax=Sporocytophaga myxococcoides TaxID=153721 RepID=A0A098LF84_9BACT|nr:AraC family transcriptional regulator [Sporocytophaga myxococcoides]GAL85625.1 AraC family transcriptional regulator [Sporocytophaga myxococcoides]